MRRHQSHLERFTADANRERNHGHAACSVRRAHWVFKQPLRMPVCMLACDRYALHMRALPPWLQHGGMHAFSSMSQHAWHACAWCSGLIAAACMPGLYFLLTPLSIHSSANCFLATFQRSWTMLGMSPGLYQQACQQQSFVNRLWSLSCRCVSSAQTPGIPPGRRGSVSLAALLTAVVVCSKVPSFVGLLGLRAAANAQGQAVQPRGLWQLARWERGSPGELELSQVQRSQHVHAIGGETRLCRPRVACVLCRLHAASAVRTAACCCLTQLAVSVCVTHGRAPSACSGPDAQQRVPRHA